MTRPAIALLSTYPPTQCGLATFTAALYEQLDRESGNVAIARVLDRPCDGLHGHEVVAHLTNGSRSSLAATALTLNSFDVVIVQHEYGIYGGIDGEEVLDLVAALTVPTIIVLHTVLTDPTPHQRSILEQLVMGAGAVVTMAETARRRLVEHYDVEASRITVIPHGAIDHRSLQTHHAVAARPLILTWGLLGPGKGIEWAIDAMPALRDLMPRYLVAGKTHPKVLEHEGERYRLCLEERVMQHSVADMVDIDASYLSLSELANLVAAADVVLLPYDSPDQVTSGVLIEAVAAGRPVISTGFPHAVELLSGGAGLIVGQKDARALAVALRRVLSEPGLAEQMAGVAASQAPSLVWSAVAQRYRTLAHGLVASPLVASPLVAGPPVAGPPVAGRLRACSSPAGLVAAS
jgi:glycosyltransferase involved in cell wall biosynthesis